MFRVFEVVLISRTSKNFETITGLYIMGNIRVVWKSTGSKNGKGLIRFKQSINGKVKVKSLGLSSIEKKHFNSKSQRVRDSFGESDYYNEVIERKLYESKRTGGNDLIVNDDNKSFIYYVRNSVIPDTENRGTSTKYENICSLLEQFNEFEYDGMDLKFSQITYDFIKKFKKWLKNKEERGRHCNSEITSNYKIKQFKGLMMKGVKGGEYVYYKNPFDNFKLTFVSGSIEILTKEEVQRIMNTQIQEVYRSDKGIGNKSFGEIIYDESLLHGYRYNREGKIPLSQYRDVFVFQLFSNGLRVSDVMTLRYNDFKQVGGDIRIVKRMIKTGKEISIKPNTQMLDILYKFQPQYTQGNYHPNNQIQQYYDEIEQLRMSTPNDEDLIDVYFQFGTPIEQEMYNNFGFKIGGRDSVKIGRDSNGKKIGGMGGKVSVNLIREKIEEIKGDDDYRDEIIGVNEDGEDDIVPIHFGGEEVTKRLTLLGKVEEYVSKKLKVKINNHNEKLFKVIDDKNHLIEQMIYKNSISGEDNYSQNFVFPLLKEEDFFDIDEKNDFSTMTDIQYGRFVGGRSYYNKMLKPIAKQCGIHKKLTSHVARHSFVSLMLALGKNINLYDIKEILGHSHLNTTQKYIQKFNNEKLDNLGQTFSDSF
jgi:site-specific recombinase XerD